MVEGYTELGNLNELFVSQFVFYVHFLGLSEYALITNLYCPIHDKFTVVYRLLSGMHKDKHLFVVSQMLHTVLVAFLIVDVERTTFPASRTTLLSWSLDSVEMDFKWDWPVRTVKMEQSRLFDLQKVCNISVVWQGC